MRHPATVVLALLLAGCAVPFAPFAKPAAPPPPLLARGDEQLAAGNLQAAVGLYDEFLQSAPDDPAAPRVRATRALLARLFQVAVALHRLEEEVRLREEELGRARAELSALRGEATRLKADLQRLKLIDLQLERKTR